MQRAERFLNVRLFFSIAETARFTLCVVEPSNQKRFGNSRCTDQHFERANRPLWNAMKIGPSLPVSNPENEVPNYICHRPTEKKIG